LKNPMRVWLSTLAITMVAGLALAEKQGADRANADHLSPVDRADEKMEKFRALLNLKLGVTGFDCGRVIDSSSLGPEGVLSVWSETKTGRRTYHVTSVEAIDNLWQLTKSMRQPDNARAVATHRMDVEISEAIAEKIKQAWTKMLETERPASSSEVRYVMDGYLDFSIQRPGDSSALYGQIRLPAPGPKTEALAKISDALWEYCKAAPADRPAIANKIDREATRLLALLK
jgi:hypothetical protein